MSDTTDAARERLEAKILEADVQSAITIWFGENEVGKWRENAFVQNKMREFLTFAYRAALARAGQQQARLAELEGEVERLREALQAVQSAIADGVFGDKGWSGRERALNEQISAALARQAGG